ncbi:hypothetical protein EMCRGX_G004428 [Ephydatia muelleri]
MNYSSSFSSDDVLFSATNSISVLVCLLAAILVFTLKLYKRVVYRLALYQVLAALAIALVELSQIFMVSYRNEDFPPLYAEGACVAIACLGLYTLWVKLFFTTWVSFHLFCLAVLGKNMKKLELLYVVTSLLVPFTIAVVPLITHSYGFSKIDGCSIPAYSANNTLWLRIAAIERFSLLEGPALCILLASSSAMIVMVIKLGHNFCRRRKYEKYEEISDHYRVHWTALKQLLPLAAFPLLFFIFIIPDKGLVLVAYLSTSLWSMSSGVTLLIHITVVRLPPYCRASKSRTGINHSLYSTAQTVTRGSIPQTATHTTVGHITCDEMESSTTQVHMSEGP